MRIVCPVVPEDDIGDLWMVRRPDGPDQSPQSLVEPIRLVDLLRRTQHQSLGVRDIALITTSQRKAMRTATQIVRRAQRATVPGLPRQQA